MYRLGGQATQRAEQMSRTVLVVSRRDTMSINRTKDPMLSSAQGLTHNKEPDVVIDTFGNMEIMSPTIKLLAVGGRPDFINVGKCATAEFKEDMQGLYSEKHSIIGCSSLEHEAKEMGCWPKLLMPMFVKGELQGGSKKDLNMWNRGD